MDRFTRGELFFLHVVYPQIYPRFIFSYYDRLFCRH